MKLSLTFIVILAMAVPCIAGDVNEISIGYAPICRHFDYQPELNEVNHGLFVTYNKWFVGTFNNSHYIRSWFMGRTFRTKKWYPFGNEVFGRGNFHLGLLYGYGEYMPSIDGWTIGATPTFEMGYKQFSVETMVMPADGGVISVLFKWTWQKKVDK